MSYLARTIIFEHEAPEIFDICSKLSELTNLNIAIKDQNIFISDKPEESINISKSKDSIIISGYYEASPFLVNVLTNYLINIGGKCPTEPKNIVLPVTIKQVDAYNDIERAQLRKSALSLWTYIISLVILGISLVAGALYVLYAFVI